MSGPGEGTVLVVDDDRMVRSFIRHALARGGLEIEEAFDGRAALQRLGAGGRIDAVLLDGLLPDMHGVALARRLIDRPGGDRLPICFLTGAVRGKLAAAAGIGCLPKPARPSELVGEVRALIAWAAGGGSPADERHAVLSQLEQGFLVGP